MDTSGRRGRQTEQDVPLAMGRTEAGVEAAAVRLGTNRVYRFRVQHPWVYGGIAFIIGAFLVGLFIASGYSSWSYQAINLVTASYALAFGMLCGGIVMALLAFAYALTVRPTIAPDSGVTYEKKN